MTSWNETSAGPKTATSIPLWYGSSPPAGLPKSRLKDYAVLRWPFQARADLAMMISHVAYLEGDDAHHLLENAFDEILRPAGEGDHPGLWVQFARRLGATQAELDEAAANPLAEVAGFPLTMTYYCRRSAEEGLASWYADEEQLPEVHGATALALRKYYGCDDETIEYFLEHVRADIVHSDANEGLLSRYCDTPIKVARARRAAAATLWAWRDAPGHPARAPPAVHRTSRLREPPDLSQTLCFARLRPGRG